MLYYWARTYGSLIQRGEEYRKLRPVRSIVITEFPVFPELKELHAVFEIHAREKSAVLLSKHFQLHVLRLGDWLRSQSGLVRFVSACSVGCSFGVWVLRRR
jgi:predicted transposase/invertase (TIGR01784 family)